MVAGSSSSVVSIVLDFVCRGTMSLVETLGKDKTNLDHLFLASTVLTFTGVFDGSKVERSSALKEAPD